MRFPANEHNGDFTMKKRYAEEQIVGAIREHEAGAKVAEICRSLSNSSGTFCNLRNKYVSLEANRKYDTVKSGLG